MNSDISLIKEYNKGSEKKYLVHTLGCQLNENDSEKLSGMLREMGFIAEDEIENADIIVYNTCSVRENAEQKVYGHLGRLKKLKEKKTGLIIALCGCMMQQQKNVEHIKKVYSHVDIIFGTYNLQDFPGLLLKVLKGKQHAFDIKTHELPIFEGFPAERKEKIKAWVTIMYGCNNFCSYCIVPYVRGRERSRREEDILNEIHGLAKQGFREVTLLGQNVNSYGSDYGDKNAFSKLLNKVSEIEGIERIRFMTSHPKDLSDELIFTMKNSKKVCRHLHLPFQSGSTRILKMMNRNYTKEYYLNLAEKIKENIEGISVTTDIIVGFPGETEEDFENTIDILEKVRFDSAYTFLYSEREGTPAASSNEKVPENVMKNRFDKLLVVQNRISKEINNTYEGKEVEVLVEGRSKSDSSTLTGRTETFKIVNFKGEPNLTGTFQRVKIEKALTWSLEGKLL